MITARKSAKLTRRLRYWQDKLALNDWDVLIFYVPAEGMAGPERLGECHVAYDHKRAVIKLLEPKERPVEPWPFGDDEGICHELMHIHLAPFDSDNENNPLRL